MMNFLKYLIMVLLLAAVGAAATNLTECGPILSQGEYYLQNDVSSNGTCFEIDINNVVLDCQGHRITGNGTGYGVYNQWYSNTTVKNCVIKNFSTGMGDIFYLAENNTVTHFSDYGIYSDYSGTVLRNNTVANATGLQSLEAGIFARGTIEYNTIEHINGSDICGLELIENSTVRFNRLEYVGSPGENTADALCVFVNGSSIYNNTIRSRYSDSGSSVNFGSACYTTFENNTVEMPGSNSSIAYLNGNDVIIRNNFFNRSVEGSGINVYGAYNVLIEGNYFYSGINGSSVFVGGGHDVNITGNKVYNGELLKSKKENKPLPSYNVRAWNNTIQGYTYDVDTGLPMALGVYVEEGASATVWNNTFKNLGKPGTTNRVVTAALVYYNESKLSFYNNTVTNITAPGVYGAQCTDLIEPGPSVIENNTFNNCGQGTTRYDSAIIVSDDTGEVSISGNTINTASNNAITLMNATGYNLTQLNSSNTFSGITGNRVEKRWVARVKVEDQFGTPLSSAHVELNDSTGTNVENSTTGSLGFTHTSIFDWSTLMPVQDFIDSTGATGARTPHNVSASWQGYYNYTEFTANSSLQGSYIMIVIWRNETYIQSCTNLSNSGFIYVLNESILYSNVSQCMNFTANDTVLKCEPGVVLEGNYSTNAGKAVYLASDNIVLRDCTIRGWDTAVYANASRTRMTFYNLTITNVSNGLFFCSGSYHDGNLTSLTFENISTSGISCSSSLSSSTCWNFLLQDITFSGPSAAMGAMDLEGHAQGSNLALGEYSFWVSVNNSAEFSHVNAQDMTFHAYNGSVLSITDANTTDGAVSLWAHDSSQITLDTFSLYEENNDNAIELYGTVTIKNGLFNVSFDEDVYGITINSGNVVLENVTVLSSASGPVGERIGITDGAGNTVYRNVTVKGWYTTDGVSQSGGIVWGAGSGSITLQDVVLDSNTPEIQSTVGTMQFTGVTIQEAGVTLGGSFTNVSIDNVSSVPSDPSGWKNISKYWKMTNVSGPGSASSSVHYSDSDWQNAGVNETTLTVFRYNGTAWENLSSTVDSSANKVSASIAGSFSAFGVFGYSDNTPPTVVLNSPSDGATATSSAINFTYTPSDDNGLANCSLWTNRTGAWQALATDTSILNGTQNTFNTTSWTNGTYIWNVQCYDTAGNSAWAAANHTFTVSTDGGGVQTAGSVTVVSAPGYDLFSVVLLMLAGAAFVFSSSFKQFGKLLLEA